MPKDPFDVLDDDEDEESAEEELLDDLDAPMDLPVVYVDKTKPVEIVTRAETSDKHVNEFKDEFVHCEHTWFTTRSGFDRCPKCSSSKITGKQKGFLYVLWTRRFGVMTKTAADFIDNLSIDEASTIIDKLRRR